MKKLTKLMAIAMSAVIASSLVACGGNENNKPKGGNDDDEVYDATVSATEWVSALSLKDLVNFKADLEQEINTTYEGEEDSDYTELIKGTTIITEFALHRQVEASAIFEDHNQIDNNLIFFDNGMRIDYARDGMRITNEGEVGFEGEIEYFYDDWVRHEDEMTLEEWLSYRERGKRSFYTPSFADYYSKFTYDAASKSYNFKAGESLEVDGMAVKSVTIKFKDKKIVNFDYEFYEEKDFTAFGGPLSKTTTKGSTVFTYGEFTITPPSSYIDYEDIEEYDATVTESEWEYVLNMIEVGDVEVKNDYFSDTTYKEGMERELYHEIEQFTFTEYATERHIEMSVGDSLQAEILNRKTFFENGIYTYYDRDGNRDNSGNITYEHDDWVKFSHDMPAYEWNIYIYERREDAFFYAHMLSYYYDKFTYDESTRSYKYTAGSGEDWKSEGKKFQSVEVKFKNKKVVSISYSLYGDAQDFEDFGFPEVYEESVQGTSTFKYGDFTITPPTSFIDSEGL
ncbi:MAG: hypothetical protein J1F69_05610 [Clostridiales bacterium]|nr:hypothetical protein [Clostridiales bacterium]